MNAEEKLKERVAIFDSAVRMNEKPKRTPFITNDAFWRYYDLGYKLSEAMADQQIIEDAVIEFQKKYEFDLLLDIGDRNPMILTRTLGNFQYNIDDKSNTLWLKEQCHFFEEDYDDFVENPVKTLWEKVLPRKYTYFTPEMELQTLQATLGKFLEYSQAMEKTTVRLIQECGVPPIYDLACGNKIFPAFECLYNFLRGMKGLSRDLRTCPEKVLAFNEVFHNTFLQMNVDAIKPVDVPSSAFTEFTIMLSQNMINPKQFEKFYWPQFKLIADKVIATGGTLFTLSEGTTFHISDFLQDLPKGHFCFYVETDDIFEARKRYPDLCLWGGLPISLISKGTKQECVDYAKRVVDEVGRDGGLLLSTNKFTANPSDCNSENLLAVSEFIRKY